MSLGGLLWRDSIASLQGRIHNDPDKDIPHAKFGNYVALENHF
jgi:hypothetical protein